MKNPYSAGGLRPTTACTLTLRDQVLSRFVKLCSNFGHKFPCLIFYFLFKYPINKQVTRLNLTRFRERAGETVYS